MKNLFYFLLIFVMVGCDKEEDMEKSNTSLSGFWVTGDAQCPIGNFYDEEIFISHTEDSIIATKVTGSICVPANEVSFRGANVLIDDSYYEVTWTTGNTSDPSCCTTPGTVMLTEECRLHTTWNGNNVIEYYKKGFDNPIDYRINGSIPVIKQPTNLTCWAATAVMMVSWKEDIVYSFTDFFDIYPTFKNEFETNTPLPAASIEDFYADLGLQGRQMSYSVSGIRSLLEENGPLLTVASTRLGDNTSAHVRIIVEILGDGSIQCSNLKFIDPSGGRIYTEPFEVFSERYQDIADQNAIPLLYYFD